MKYIKIILVAAVIVGIVELAIYIYYRRSNSENALVLYGNVDIRQVDLSFRVPGKVIDLKFEEGEFVRKGDVVAILDQNPYSNEATRSLANLLSVKARYENSQKLLENRLGVINESAVSVEDLDVSATNYESLKAEVAAAESALAIAEDNLSYTVCYAPNDGVILTRIKEPGSVVSAGDPVYNLSILSPLWVRAYIDEPDLGKISYGMEARVYTDVKGGKVYRGKVGFISPVAEFTPKTVQTEKLRTALVYGIRVYVDDPDQVLKQGMPVTVKLFP